MGHICNCNGQISDNIGSVDWKLDEDVLRRLMLTTIFCESLLSGSHHHRWPEHAMETRRRVAERVLKCLGCTKPFRWGLRRAPSTLHLRQVGLSARSSNGYSMKFKSDYPNLHSGPRELHTCLPLENWNRKISQAMDGCRQTIHRLLAETITIKPAYIIHQPSPASCHAHGIAGDIICHRSM